MATFKNPTKGDEVHYVLSSNAHRIAKVVRVFPPSDDALMPMVDLAVFLDGKNDTIEGTPLVWIGAVSYEVAAAVNSWHWADGCHGHEND